MGTDHRRITSKMGASSPHIASKMETDPRIAIEMDTSPRAPPTAILARTIDAPPLRQPPQPPRKSPQAPRKHAALSGGQGTVRQWWPRVSVPENYCGMNFL